MKTILNEAAAIPLSGVCRLTKNLIQVMASSFALIINRPYEKSSSLIPYLLKNLLLGLFRCCLMTTSIPIPNRAAMPTKTNTRNWVTVITRFIIESF